MHQGRVCIAHLSSVGFVYRLHIYNLIGYFESSNESLVQQSSIGVELTRTEQLACS